MDDGSAGMMYYPVPWWNRLGDGLVMGERPDSSWDFRETIQLHSKINDQF